MRVMKSHRGQYTLLNSTTNKEKEYYSTQLKKFIFNPARVSPSDVARKDYLEFFFDSILSHKGNIKMLSTLDFKVKWLGYDETHNSFESWKNLRNTEQFHLYLLIQNLKHLISSKLLNISIHEDFSIFLPNGF
jgi:Chromo (CHRromatin Organisation MOdifier) domain